MRIPTKLTTDAAILTFLGEDDAAKLLANPDDVARPKVALEKEGLPKAHFTWHCRQYVSAETAEVAAQFNQVVGFEALTATKSSTGETIYNGFVSHRRASELFFCNFRRYGWSWTSDPAGKHGYGHGPTYANSLGGTHFLYDSREELVRGTLSEAWAELCRRNTEFARVFSNRATSLVLRWLRDDALANMSVHATPWQGRRDCDLAASTWCPEVVGVPLANPSSTLEAIAAK